MHLLIPNGVFLPSPPRGEGPGVRGSIIDLYRLKTPELYEVKNTTRVNSIECPLTPNPSPRRGEGNQTQLIICSSAAALLS